MCCFLARQPFHAGAAVAPTPVSLLRTRFCAYCKGLGDYVVKTTHPDNDILKNGSRTADGVVVSTLAADVAASASKLRFSDLEVLAESPGTAPDQAIVAFRYKARALATRCCSAPPSLTRLCMCGQDRCKWSASLALAAAAAPKSR
jgi:SEC-C motif-containing protein